jgi:hypothetical protein
MWALLATNLALIRVVLLSEVTLTVLSLISQSLELLYAAAVKFVDEMFVSPSTIAVVTPAVEVAMGDVTSAILLHCVHTHN